jgi:hypothetical protein
MLILVAVLLPDVGFVSAQNFVGNGLGTLQGTVTGFDQYGDRMSLPWVRVNATSRRFNSRVYTGINGLYVMVLPPGNYTVSTFLQGYVSRSENVTIVSGQLMLLDFTLRSVFAVSPSPS